MRSDQADPGFATDEHHGSPPAPSVLSPGHEGLELEGPPDERIQG
jgi:hypothetical protein